MTTIAQRQTDRRPPSTQDADFIPPDVTNPDLVAEANGQKHITFTATFYNRDQIDFAEAGSADASCQ